MYNYIRFPSPRYDRFRIKKRYSFVRGKISRPICMTTTFSLSYLGTTWIAKATGVPLRSSLMQQKKKNSVSLLFLSTLEDASHDSVAECLCAMCACATFPVGASHQQGPSLTIVYCPLAQSCFLTGQNSRKWECSPNTFLELHPHSLSQCTPPSKKHSAQRGSTPNRMLISDTLFRKSGREQVEMETDRLKILFPSTQAFVELTNQICL